MNRHPNEGDKDDLPPSILPYLFWGLVLTGVLKVLTEIFN